MCPAVCVVWMLFLNLPQSFAAHTEKVDTQTQVQMSLSSFFTLISWVMPTPLTCVVSTEGLVCVRNIGYLYSNTSLVETQ